MEHEYKTVTVDCKDMEPSLNTLTAQLNCWGKEGWELVSSLTHPYLGSSQYSLVGLAHRVTLIFKRLNQSGEAAQAFPQSPSQKWFLLI